MLAHRDDASDDELRTELRYNGRRFLEIRRPPLARGISSVVYNGLLRRLDGSGEVDVVAKVKRLKSTPRTTRARCIRAFFQELYVQTVLARYTPRVPAVLAVARWKETSHADALVTCEAPLPMTLSAFLRAKASAARTRRVMVQVCTLLRDLQARFKFVHRDLHSENLMVDGDGTAYLIDFGRSRLEHEEEIIRVGNADTTSDGDRGMDLIVLLVSLYEKFNLGAALDDANAEVGAVRLRGTPTAAIAHVQAPIVAVVHGFFERCRAQWPALAAGDPQRARMRAVSDHVRRVTEWWWSAADRRYRARHVWRLSPGAAGRLSWFSRKAGGLDPPEGYPEVVRRAFVGANAE
jgi:hypothetical protein